MSISKTLRFEVFKRDGFTCQYCGRTTPVVILETDHVIPRVDGGDDDIENLVTACFDCNRGKGKRLLETVIKEGDLEEKTVLLAERERQIREYNEVRRQQKEREDREIGELCDHFVSLFPEWQAHHARDGFKRVSIRPTLKITSYLEIMDYIDRAVWRTKDNDRGEYHTVAASKYLNGILRNIREKAAGGGDGTES